MRQPSSVGAVFGAVALVVAATGCSSTSGTPVAERAEEAAATVTAPSSSVATPSPVAPTGEPVGTAVMAVRGGDASVTLRYRINDGPEQTETNVSLPWEKEYPVYEKLESEVSADGGDAELICTIIFNGDQLVTFVTEPRPTCSFAYWG